MKILSSIWLTLAGTWRRPSELCATGLELKLGGGRGLWKHSCPFTSGSRLSAISNSAPGSDAKYSSIRALMIPSGCACCLCRSRPMRLAMYGVTLFPVSPVMKRLASVAVAVAAEAVGPTARAPDDAALDDARRELRRLKDFVAEQQALGSFVTDPDTDEALVSVFFFFRTSPRVICCLLLGGNFCTLSHTPASLSWSH